MTERRTLAEHVTEALEALADGRRTFPAELAGHMPDVVETWLADARERVVVEAEVDRRRGRVDHRSLAVTARLLLHTPPGARPEDVPAVRLGRWRVRDLVDSDGQRIDTAQAVRDLLAQHAAVPDDLSGLDNL